MLTSSSESKLRPCTRSCAHEEVVAASGPGAASAPTPASTRASARGTAASAAVTGVSSQATKPKQQRAMRVGLEAEEARTRARWAARGVAVNGHEQPQLFERSGSEPARGASDLSL